MWQVISRSLHVETAHAKSQWRKVLPLRTVSVRCIVTTATRESYFDTYRQVTCLLFKYTLENLFLVFFGLLLYNIFLGEKPFKCDECESSFRQKQLLKRHKNIYHTQEYIAPSPRPKVINVTFPIIVLQCLSPTPTSTHFC